MNILVQQFIYEFTDFFDGDPWFGDNYQTIIKDISDAEALHVPANGHSIARLLWHMVKWRRALAERLIGNLDYRAAVSDADNWRDLESIDANSWKEAKKQFDALQSLIVSELRLRNDAFLEDEFLPGHPYKPLVAGVVQHDIYHLGQIAFYKSVLRCEGK
jgi:uncharacterized damage-inducible protein DinB